MLAAVLPEKDCKLILRYCAEYPELWNKLDGFMWLAPELRPRQSMRLLKDLLREEWMRYGFTQGEIDDLFAFKRKMINFDREYRPEHLNALATKLRIWVYDLPNTVLGQSRATEEIPTEDQCALQRIAGRILFAAPRYRENYEALMSLIAVDTQEDRWIKDVERLLVLDSCGRKSPDGGRFQDLWQEFRPDWKTMDGMMLSYRLRYNVEDGKMPSVAHELIQ